MAERTFDRGEDETDADIISGDINMMRKSYLRLRCLEIAVRTWHPEDSVDPVSATAAAQLLLNYVLTGKVMQPAPDYPEKEV